MKNSRFSEEQIIGILKQSEAGAKTAELCRQHGISPATFYIWRSKYGGLKVNEAKRLKQLEEFASPEFSRYRASPSQPPIAEVITSFLAPVVRESGNWPLHTHLAYTGFCEASAHDGR